MRRDTARVHALTVASQMATLADTPAALIARATELEAYIAADDYPESGPAAAMTTDQPEKAGAHATLKLRSK